MNPARERCRERVAAHVADQVLRIPDRHFGSVV
jgi:hypothetical protein